MDAPRTLNPLQYAALECIERCQRELAEAGYFPRTAVELEFCAMDSQRQLAQISLSHSNRFSPRSEVLELARKHVVHGEYIQRLTYEAVGGVGFHHRQEPQAKDQYEIVIAESSFDVPHAFDPAKIAQCTIALQQGGMQEAVERCSFNAGKDVRLDFSAFPQRGSANAMRYLSQGQGLTSGMHINASLYNALGENMFQYPSILALHAAWAMLQLQKQTWPLILHDEQSQQRLYANNSAPGGIGGVLATTMSDIDGNNCKNNRAGTFPISMRMIQPFSDKANAARIENRLPGADSDPYLAMALTLAALVYAVRMEQGQAIPDFLIPPPDKTLKEAVFSDKQPYLAAPVQSHVEALRDLLGDTLLEALSRKPEIYPPPPGWGISKSTVVGR